MAFGKFLKSLLHLPVDETYEKEKQALEDRPKPEPRLEPKPETSPEPPPEPTRLYLWFLLILLIVGNILVFAYFGVATDRYLNREATFCLNPPNHEGEYQICGIKFCDGFGMLMILFVAIYVGLFYFLLFKPLIGRRIHRSILAPSDDWWMNISRTWLVSIILFVIAMGFMFTIIALEIVESFQKITGIVAPLAFVGLGFAWSTKPSKVQWRIVITGIFFQFLLGVICLRWPVGREIFQCFGSRVAAFLQFASKGSAFVFGPNLITGPFFAFAFGVLPVIFFFSFFVSILYYWGAMQWIVMKLGWILQQMIGTTVCESVVASANIFLGMSESPLLIRPYIKFLTASEIHAIMVSGFATVSGTVLAAYITFGASPAHLITSSIMAAPGALAFSKLYMPETEESQTSSENIQLEKSEDESVLGAASSGAILAIPIVLGITANIVAFLGCVAFLDALVNWLFLLIDVHNVDFVWIFSRLFIPIAWGMGVPWDDLENVANVLALKTIVNEFIAYERLGKYTRAKEISARSSGIATFAICGFANPGSIGILIGTLCAISPTSKTNVVGVAFRAFVVGSIVCFVSASFAGILLNEEMEKAMYDRIFDTLGSHKNDTGSAEATVAPTAAAAAAATKAPAKAPAFF